MPLGLQKSAHVAVVILLFSTLAWATPTSAQEEDAADDRPVRWFDETIRVTGEEVFEDTVLHVNRTITVAAGGKLVLRNVELVFHGAGVGAAISSQMAGNGLPAGIIHLVSTDKGPTRLHHADPRGSYFFTSWGEFKALGRPEAPVVIEHVTGSSGGADEMQVQALFMNGLQLIGRSNEIDHVVFQDSGSGIGISSTGETRITNATVRRVAIPLYLHEADGVLVADSTLEGARAALYANLAKNVTVRSTELTGGYYGLLAHGSNVDVVASGFEAGYTGALLYNGGRYALQDNRFSGYASAAITAGHNLGGSPVAPSILARGNTLSGDGVAVAGILAEFADDIVLHDNVVRNHRESGIYVGIAGFADIRENLVVQNGRFGIEISVAAFREDANRFGDEAADRNGRGAFSGSSGVKVLVEDGSGEPVPNATVTLAGDALEEPRVLTTGADGTATAILETLFVTSEGERAEHAYAVTATKQGAGGARVDVVPYRHDAPHIVLALDPAVTDVGANDAAKDPGVAGSVSVPAIGGAVLAGIAILAVVAIGRTRRKRTVR